MSYFHRPDTKLEERVPPQERDDQPRSPFADVAGRVANWFTGMDRLPEDEPTEYDSATDPFRALTAGPSEPEQSSSRFPVAPFGYSRAAVDEHLAEVERELAGLRAQRPEPPISVTEELERIGEQTASILVVAHDKAHETTRQAQAQAERCIADAAANAVAITEEAKARLRQLDTETDAVWRERERLLEDVRTVSAALATLADQASERFPAAVDQASTTAFPVAGAPAERRGSVMAFEPQETAAFSVLDESEASYGTEAQFGDADDSGDWSDQESGDTGSWLAGLEPPDAGT